MFEFAFHNPKLLSMLIILALFAIFISGTAPKVLPAFVSGPQSVESRVIEKTKHSVGDEPVEIRVEETVNL